MEKLFGIKFKGDDRLYFVHSSIDRDFVVGMPVIVTLENGIKFATVTNINSESSREYPSIGDIVRIASEEDIIKNREIIVEQDKALNKCKKLVNKLNLKMHPIRTEYTFDKNQLLIYFFSEERVDFRELAKQMASIFKTRIEFRQVGIRDRSKIVGGIGPCGRKLCCSSFLYDFDSISISMAKNQMLALNPTKINGACGRLLCCLNYEDEMYKQYRSTLPQIGSSVVLDGKEGRVIQLDLYNQKYIVEYVDHTQKEIAIDTDDTN